MTIANPISGKVDHTTTATATELNAIGVACASAVDAVGGGTITPSAIINLNGSGAAFGTDGGVGMVSCRNTGAFVRTGSAATMTERVASTVADSDTLLTVASDFFLCSTPTADRYHGLSNTGASNGMRIIVKRPATGNFVVVIRRNATGAGAAIVTMAALTDTSAEFWFVGGVWRLGPYSAGCTPGAES